MSLLFLCVAVGIFIPEPEARNSEKSTEETVFDHIRRKSKDFPLPSELDYMNSMVHKNESFTKNHSTSLKATLGMATEINSLDTVTDDMLPSYKETADVEKYSSSVQAGTEVKRKNSDGFGCVDGVLNKGAFSNSSIQSSIYTPIVSFSMVKEKRRSLDAGCFAESDKKKHCPSRESEEKSGSSEIRRQCCYLETTGQMKEAESYLGFKSVFSFL